jgi:excisionase family DNA binding protein
VFRTTKAARATEGAPRFHSVAGAAKILGTSEVTLYRAIHAGQFPALKIRGRYVIPARVLDEMEEAALSSGAMVDAAAWAETRGAA